MVFLFVSCEKDEISNSEKGIKSNQHYSVQSVTHEQIIDNADLYQLIKEQMKHTGDPQNRQDRLEFSTEHGKFIGYGDYHSYTFPVTNSLKGVGLENVVFFSQPNGGYRIFLMVYSYTGTEIERLKDGYHVPLGKDAFTFVELNEDYEPLVTGKEDGCIEVVIAWCSYGNHPGGYESDGSECQGHEETIIFTSGCGGGGGGFNPPPPPPSTGPPPPPSTGPPTPPSDGDSNPNGGFYGNGGVTTPTVITRNHLQEAFDCLGIPTAFGEEPVLAQAVIDSLGNNFNFTRDLNYFLQGEGCSEEAQDFGAAAATAWFEGGEVDYENHIENYNFHTESPEILAFEPGYRDQMSQAELAIFDNLTRLQQLDYLHSAYLAKTYSEIYYEPNTLYNGVGDAYRHTLWNALGAAKLGETLMEQLTNAHEVPDPGETNNPLEETMDLHNNQVGRDIGSQSSFMLMMKVKFAVENGETNYISPRALGGGVIPGVSQIIPTDQ